MNPAQPLYALLLNHVHACLKRAFPEAPVANITLEQPRVGNAHYATNAAMVLTKALRQPPRTIAETLQAPLAESPFVATVEIANPGFLNITLTPTALMHDVQLLLNTPEAFLNAPKLANAHTKTINLEYVSINPTGPIHVGHGRNAVLGDVLGRLLEKVGHTVFREYLINDAGNQIRTLVLSVHARYKELFGQPLDLPENGYVGDYIVDIAQALKDQDGEKWLHETDETTLRDGLRQFCVDTCMKLITTDLDHMGLAPYDRFHSEFAMHQTGDPLAEAITDLRAKGLVYEGTLPPPHGVNPETYEAAELTLYKATEDGLARDKALYNRRGEATYMGQDLAYAKHKLDLHDRKIDAKTFDELVIVVGKDQVGNFAPLKGAVKHLTGRDNVLHPFYYAMVKTVRNGEPVKLSKRAGNIVALADVLAEVGTDAYRFHMLNRKADTELVFDLQKAVEATNENPVFYVQYAHARLCSLLKRLPTLPDNYAADGTVALSENHASVAQALGQYPVMLTRAAEKKEPHLLASYAIAVAEAFHRWYGAEKMVDDTAPAALTHARTATALATRKVLKDVLDVMGVSAPESM